MGAIGLPHLFDGRGFALELAGYCDDYKIRRRHQVIPLKLVVFKSRIFSGRYLRGFTMKNGRFSDARIMAVLKPAEGGVPVSELCLEHGMSIASFYK